MNEKLKQWCIESVERAAVESRIRIAIYSATNEVKSGPGTETTMTPEECQALKDLRDSIQDQIDLFCSVIV